MRMQSLGRNVWRGVMAGLVLTAFGVVGAQASSLLVGTNYQESSNKTSTAPPGGTACNNSVYCYIVFKRVPVGKQLIVTRVACQLSVSTGNVSQLNLLPQRTNGTFVERFQNLASFTRPSSTPGNFVVANEAAFALFDERDFPEIHLQLTAAANILGFCTIAGQLIDKVP